MVMFSLLPDPLIVGRDAPVHEAVEVMGAVAKKAVPLDGDPVLIVVQVSEHPETVVVRVRPVVAKPQATSKSPFWSDPTEKFAHVTLVAKAALTQYW